jgi:inorganic pyrophosphatase/exopolyphosphatase
VTPHLAQDADTAIKGAMLSCILSDTLEFRSPTTTQEDRAVAEALAADLDVDIPSYAAEMFAAKSDVSEFSDAELLRMDSKEYEVGGKSFRVSVLETTSPETVLVAQGQSDGNHANRGTRGWRRSGALCSSSISCVKNRPC